MMTILSKVPGLFEFAVNRGALNLLDDYSKSFILHKQPLFVENKFEFTTSLSIENTPALSDYCENYSSANGDKKQGIRPLTAKIG